MRLYIHTYGRANKQTTWNLLPKQLKAETTFVVQKREAPQWVGTANVLILPANIRTLSPTRQWILDQHSVKLRGPFLCLLDDDLRFDKRRMDKAGLFQVATEADILALFAKLERVLKAGYVHAGLLEREGGNRCETPFRVATRMSRVLAYNVAEVRKVDARFDRVPCKQDFDMTLQLLRAGCANYQICDYVQGQSGSSNAAGGCSAYRDLAMLDAAAKKLSKLHPGFVKLVQKETISAWGATKDAPVTRTEVVIAWKKAFLSSGQTLPNAKEVK